MFVVMATYNLNFHGYYLEARLPNVPHTSGVYIFYRCIDNGKTVSLQELLYIGKATDLQQRIGDHFKITDPLRLDIYLKFGEVLCFSYAEYDTRSIDVIENGLIFMQKPRANTNLVFRFNHLLPVTITCDGRCNLLDKNAFKLYNCLGATFIK